MRSIPSKSYSSSGKDENLWHQLRQSEYSLKFTEIYPVASATSLIISTPIPKSSVIPLHGNPRNSPWVWSCILEIKHWCVSWVPIYWATLWTHNKGIWFSPSSCHRGIYFLQISKYIERSLLCPAKQVLPRFEIISYWLTGSSIPMEVLYMSHLYVWKPLYEKKRIPQAPAWFYPQMSFLVGE